MTAFKFIDKREDTVLTFSDLTIGSAFTFVGGGAPSIKTEVMRNEHNDRYNTLSLDGEFYWSDSDEEIEPIRELEVIIKK